MATKIGDGWDRGICHEQQLECTEPHCACVQVRVCERERVSVCVSVRERARERERVCACVRGSDGFHYSNENNDYSDSKQDSVKKKLPVLRKVSNVVSFENLATKLGVD